ETRPAPGGQMPQTPLFSPVHADAFGGNPPGHDDGQGQDGTQGQPLAVLTQGAAWNEAQNGGQHDGASAQPATGQEAGAQRQAQHDRTGSGAAKHAHQAVQSQSLKG